MRVILDTNVWSYVGIEGSKADLESLAKSRQLSVLTPPATLLEVLRTGDSVKRDRIIDAMTSPRWIRLRTEADVECEEFVLEARRLRPHWVRQMTQPGRPGSLREFWARKIWRQAAQNSAPLAARLPRLTDGEESHVFDTMKTNSLSLRAANWQIGEPAKATYEATDRAPDSYLAGWAVGTQAPVWRVDARDIFRYALRWHVITARPGHDTTLVDWLAPYLRLDHVLRDPEDFTRFWLTDVEESRMPRTWLRGVSGVALLHYKVTKSTGRDNQLTSYLPDCDLFLSEDWRLVRALQQVKEAAPCPMPEIRLLNIEGSGGKVVDVIAAALN